ncbi:MAG: hypothetical protein IT455_11015 [Planctomycetes bacterium]|nr:hypothetical protein [Planctomycetota bacterium]
MSPDRQTAEDLLRLVVCGELAADSAEWRAAEKSFPDLAAELTAMQQVQHELDWSTEDAAALAASARSAVTAADRRLARHTGPLARRSRFWAWCLPLAAALTIVLAVVSWPRTEPASGLLGDRQRLSWQVDDRGALLVVPADVAEPGGYKLVLTIDGEVRTQEGIDFPIRLPAAWSAALRHPTATPQLELQLGSQTFAVDLPPR